MTSAFGDLDGHFLVYGRVLDPATHTVEAVYLDGVTARATRNEHGYLAVRQGGTLPPVVVRALDRNGTLLQEGSFPVVRQLGHG